MGDAARWRQQIGARPHAWAALLLGACVLGYLWPVLIGGEILSPDAILYTYTPWRGLAPSDFHHYYNWLLEDLPLVDHPWRVLVRGLLREGTVPAWNPYALGGIPLYSNTLTGLFSPFNLPLWLLPLDYGLGLSAALKLLAGGFGAYLLARELRLGFLPGLLAGIAFAFSAVNIVWLAHETLPGVVVMTPWALWLVERIFARGRPGSVVALAAVMAVALGGGHPSMQVHVPLVVGVYALVRAACLRGSPDGPASRPSLTRALALVGAGLVAGALLMAFMLIPEVRSSHGTVGVLARRNDQLPSSHMQLRAIATVAFPDWWGRPSAIEAPVTPGNRTILFVNYNERTFYAGAVALLLALVGLATPGAWRRKLPFAIVGGCALATAVHMPGLIWLARNLPVLDLVEPERIHFAFELAVALLAAFGLQAILDAPAASRRPLAVAAGALAVALATALLLGPSAADVRRTARHFATGASYAIGDVLALTAIVWFALFALGVAALLALVRARPRWRTGVGVAFVLLAVGDAYHFVHGFQPMGPASRVDPPTTPALAYLERHREDGRVVAFGPPLPPDSGLVYGLRDAQGYDPPQPTTRMLALWRRGNPEQASWKPLVLNELGPVQLKLIDALGVRYVIAEPGVRFSRRQLPTLSIVSDAGDAIVIANAAAAPRTFVPRRVRVTADARATDAAILEPRFDARTEVAVERDQADAATLAGGARGTVAVTREADARVTLRARLDRRGLVVLDDALMDGWRVRVDGRTAAPVRVDSVLRGVVVPAGSHEIVWSYAVPGLRLGALVSVLALAALVGVACAGPLRRRRARQLR